ncbi:MAG: DUF2281 domain-containing protein [Deinococcales bacterium]|nr:DUF2281 domain-containing protein [Chitinophagaceae bacterium]
MNSALLFNKLSILPENLKIEVADFVDFLLSKTVQPKTPVAPKPKFGSGKGIFKMRADFDESLTDFKEYMH